MDHHPNVHFQFFSPHFWVGDLCAGSGHLHDDLGVPGDLPLVEGPHPDRHLDGLVLGHGGGGMALSGETTGWTRTGVLEQNKSSGGENEVSKRT